jgi:hypothetical protein
MYYSKIKTTKKLATIPIKTQATPQEIEMRNIAAELSPRNLPSHLLRELAASLALVSSPKPGDLPFQQPTKYEFILNVKTAAMLGLTVPQQLLATADEVIE